jgi:hypothetical protein
MLTISTSWAAGLGFEDKSTKPSHSGEDTMGGGACWKAITRLEKSQQQKYQGKCNRIATR